MASLTQKKKRVLYIDARVQTTLFYTDTHWSEIFESWHSFWYLAENKWFIHLSCGYEYEL